VELAAVEQWGSKKQYIVHPLNLGVSKNESIFGQKIFCLKMQKNWLKQFLKI